MEGFAFQAERPDPPPPGKPPELGIAKGRIIFSCPVVPPSQRVVSKRRLDGSFSGMASDARFLRRVPEARFLPHDMRCFRHQPLERNFKACVCTPPKVMVHNEDLE